jgi:hypothetical protein
MAVPEIPNPRSAMLITIEANDELFITLIILMIPISAPRTEMDMKNTPA